MATTEELKRRVNDRILLDDRVVPADISVDVSDSTVTLSGTVPTYTSLRAAENDALFVPGVTAVYNKLKVSHPEDITIPTDAEIADRIKRIYEWHESLNSYDIVVNVENGWVTLDGSVGSYWQKITAADLAFTVTGVIDVQNELTIVPTRDVEDESIAQNIKETIKLGGDADVDKIDVIVRNGRVTLKGVADTHSEAMAAYDAAIYTTGVTHVDDQITVLRDKL